MIIMIFLLFWGLQSEGKNALSFLFQSLDKNFLIQGNVLNGYLVCFLILNTLWIHIPVLIVIVTGDLFSSEFETGTIRIVMTRPFKRFTVSLSKHFVGLLFVLLFMFCFAIFSIIPAFIVFGKGDLIVAFNGLQFIPESELPIRFLGAFGYAFLAMSSFAVFSIMISLLTKKSMVSILIALALIIISTLLQTLSSSLFNGWESFLITYHFAQWQKFFYSDIEYASIINSTIWLLLFSILCIAITVIKFKHLKITE